MTGRAYVVVPCYNEADRLDVSAFRDFLAARTDVGFCFVDDGSTDHTPDVLADLERASEHISVLRLADNSGKAEAVRRGILHALMARPSFVGYWDADLATPLDMIPVFMERLAARPALRMVIGSRVALLGHAIDRSALRHYFGRAVATAAAATLSMPVYDTQCGAKLLRVDEQTAALFATPFCANWMFDVELIARIAAAEPRQRPPGSYINEIPLEVWHDVAGSKVRLWDGVRALRELLRIRRRYAGRSV